MASKRKKDPVLQALKDRMSSGLSDSQKKALRRVYGNDWMDALISVPERRLESKNEASSSPARDASHAASAGRPRLSGKRSYAEFFKTGSRYLFKVERVSGNVKYGFTVVLKDRYGTLHECESSCAFSKGDTVVCKVMGVREQDDPARSLILAQPSPVESAQSATATPAIRREVVPYVRDYGAWRRRLEGFEKHVCGNEHVCDCCRTTFQTRRGYRFEGIDAYICFDCFGKIFPRGEKPEPTEWMQIIYTNMGHKR